MKFVDLEQQQQRIRSELDLRIARVLGHGRYIGGPEIPELESRLSEYTGADYCVSCANGTDALQIALMALKVGYEDEVIVPAFSFVATAEVVALLGAKLVYVDIDEESYNLDASKLDQAITEKTKAIIVVSLFGNPAAMDEINAIAAGHGLVVIEDAAQSFGATYKGTKSCNTSSIACTSFFPSKPLGCFGDGGAMFTSDPELAIAMRQIANHGQDGRYNHVRLGVNSRLDTLQAAILLSKLDLLDEERDSRARIAARFSQELQHVQTPRIADHTESAWAQYTVRVPNQAQFVDEMQSFGVPTAIHYPRSLNQQRAVSDGTSMPVSERASKEVVSLPVHAYLSIEEQELITTAANQSVRKS